MSWVFSYLLYPTVVLGIFLYIISMQLLIVGAAETQIGAVRRLTGALLPVVALIFLVAPTESAAGQTGIIGQVGSRFEQLIPSTRFLIGLATGFLLLESGKLLLEAKNDAAASVQALFLSTIGAFLLWAVLTGMLRIINFTLLGLVISGGLHVIFRGPPETRIQNSQPGLKNDNGRISVRPAGRSTNPGHPSKIAAESDRVRQTL